MNHITYIDEAIKAMNHTLKMFGVVLLAAALTVTGFLPARLTARAQELQDACTVELDSGLQAHTITTEADGEREYLLYIPENYAEHQPNALVFSLHGSASWAEEQMSHSQWNRVADEYGFIVVYPQGSGTPAGWDSGQTLSGLMALFSPQRGDDIGFLDALIDQLLEDYCVDAARVYFNGLSNGAGMSNRLACELADKVAAIGGVSGAYHDPPNGCNPSRPVPIIAIHGDADRVSSIEGVKMAGMDLMPPPEWAEAWAERNGCDDQPETLPNIGAVSGIRYGDCDQNAEVIFYTIAGSGHTWAGGGDVNPFLGEVNRDIDASTLLWQFFEQHPMATRP